MTVYFFVLLSLAILVIAWCLARKAYLRLTAELCSLKSRLGEIEKNIGKLSDIAEDFQKSSGQLKKFSKNLEALFKVEKQKKGGEK